MFTAPTDGSYTFQLWGSPGGLASYGGAYTEITLKMKQNESIYAFVGSAGTASVGNTVAGGYNGGAPALVCLAGPHGASGGGATHISYANNPIITDVYVRVINGYGTNIINRGSNPVYSYQTITLYTNGSGISDAWIRNQLKQDTYWGPYVTDSTGVTQAGSGWYVVSCHGWKDTNKVIAVAGGAGGQSSMSYGYGGVDIAGSGTAGQHSNLAKRIVTANNNTGVGYARGSGQWCNNSSGAGGGWLGGFSAQQWNNVKQTNGGNCGSVGGGGTSYINRSSLNFVSGFSISGSDARLGSGGSYQKPATEGVNGYIKVIKN